MTDHITHQKTRGKRNLANEELIPLEHFDPKRVEEHCQAMAKAVDDGEDININGVRKQENATAAYMFCVEIEIAKVQYAHRKLAREALSKF